MVMFEPGEPEPEEPQMTPEERRWYREHGEWLDGKRLKKPRPDERY